MRLPRCTWIAVDLSAARDAGLHDSRRAKRSTFCEQFRKAKKTSRLPGIAGVASARREVLPFGALVLERLLRQMEPRQVVFSVFGIREGLFYGLLPAHRAGPQIR